MKELLVLLLLFFCVDRQRLAISCHGLLLQICLQNLEIRLDLLDEHGVLKRFLLIKDFAVCLQALIAFKLSHRLVRTRSSFSSDGLLWKLNIRAGHGIKDWHVSQRDFVRCVELIDC